MRSPLCGGAACGGVGAVCPPAGNSFGGKNPGAGLGLCVSPCGWAVGLNPDPWRGRMPPCGWSAGLPFGLKFCGGRKPSDGIVLGRNCPPAAPGSDPFWLGKPCRGDPPKFCGPGRNPPEEFLSGSIGLSFGYVGWSVPGCALGNGWSPACPPSSNSSCCDG